MVTFDIVNAGMKESQQIWFITLLLSAIAGFCDTATFVAADRIFSAHVTGNFIVFAYQLVNHTDAYSWVKLITLPVFIISVIFGGWITSKTSDRYLLLLSEGVVLTLSGVAALPYQMYTQSIWMMYAVVMLIVFAMGLQNAFGKLFSKETHGPTTMMTGNVTQAALDLGSLFRLKFGDVSIKLSLKKNLTTLGGFLAGCLLGAILAKRIGLCAVLLPGILLVFYCVSSRRK
jgi:uncharacterized membrane protein YoaK (UPF0700 family)